MPMALDMVKLMPKSNAYIYIYICWDIYVCMCSLVAVDCCLERCWFAACCSQERTASTERTRALGRALSEEFERSILVQASACARSEASSISGGVVAKELHYATGYISIHIHIHTCQYYINNNKIDDMTMHDIKNRNHVHNQSCER